MEQRISLITLGVSDLAAAETFYRGLGWTPHTSVTDGKGVVFFQAGGIVVSLWHRDELATDVGVNDPGGWGGIAVAHNVDSPEAVDAVLLEAQAAGGTISKPGGETPWGGYNGAFIDPDGHAWEIAHNPEWGLQPDGSVKLP
jgi:uncharacterized protein